MTTYSENYNVTLPNNEDGYDITPISENFETLDGILTENETAMEEINEKIGTPAETGQTLFSLLENDTKSGLTAIKSIQYIVYTLPDLKSEASAPLQTTVVPENCIVLKEMLHCTANYPHPKLLYTLTASSLELSFNNPNTQTYTYGFWIIEFC